MESIIKLVRPNILALKPYSSARSEFNGVAEVFLDANENPYGEGLNRYPDPLQRALKAQISQLKGVAADRIFLGNGSDEAIDLLLRIFCQPGQDHIITLPPTYGMYKVSAGIADVAIRTVPLLSGFQPDVKGILSIANPQSKLLFLCSPNNPTGNDFNPVALRQLLDEFPGIVVVDEAYIDFSDQRSCLEWLKDYPRLVVLQTFSKAWGLAGIRLGMAFADPYLISLFNAVKPPYNINQLTQEVALEALKDQDTFQGRMLTLLAERERLRSGLAALPFVQQVYPSSANFLLTKMEAPDVCYRYLMAQKIIVRNRSKVALCEGCLRMTVGTPAENDQLLTALQAFIPTNTSL